jgi:hypothetical protein
MVSDTVDADGRNAFNGPGPLIYNGSGNDPIYLGATSGASTFGAGFQFKTGIPQGSTIDSAFIYMWKQAYSGMTESNSDTLYLNSYDVDNASSWGNGVGTTLQADQTLNATPVVWPMVGGTPAWVDAINEWQKSCDVGPLVQVAVSRGGYTTASYIGIILGFNATWAAGKEVQFASFYTSAAHAAYIVAYYH